MCATDGATGRVLTPSWRGFSSHIRWCGQSKGSTSCAGPNDPRPDSRGPLFLRDADGKRIGQARQVFADGELYPRKCTTEHSDIAVLVADERAAVVVEQPFRDRRLAVAIAGVGREQHSVVFQDIADVRKRRLQI